MIRREDFLIPGTLLYASWRSFRIYAVESRTKFPPFDNTLTWYPIVVCDYKEDIKGRWHKSLITFYDATNTRYFDWNYKFTLEQLNEGTVYIA